MGVVSLVDHTHAAFPELRFDPVVVERLADHREYRSLVAHVRPPFWVSQRRHWGRHWAKEAEEPACHRATLLAERQMRSETTVQSARLAIEIEWDAEEQVWIAQVPALNNLSTYGDTYLHCGLAPHLTFRNSSVAR